MHTTRLRLILFLALGPLPAIGQLSTSPGRWSVGVRAGATLAGVNRSAIRSFQGVPLDNVSTKTVQTWHAGLLVNRQVSARWSVQGEVLYDQYGGQVDGQVSLGSFTTGVSTLVRLNAVEVPLLLKRSFGGGGSAGLSTRAGSVPGRSAIPLPSTMPRWPG